MVSEKPGERVEAEITVPVSVEREGDSVGTPSVEPRAAWLVSITKVVVREGFVVGAGRVVLASSLGDMGDEGVVSGKGPEIVVETSALGWVTARSVV